MIDREDELGSMAILDTGSLDGAGRIRRQGMPSVWDKVNFENPDKDEERILQQKWPDIEEALKKKYKKKKPGQHDHARQGIREANYGVEPQELWNRD